MRIGAQPGPASWLAALALGVAASFASAQGAVLHVDPAGDDRDSGSAERPLATLGEALDRLARQSGAGEVVLHAGSYPPVEIGQRAEREGAPRARLVVRAARRADGSFEEVRFEAGERVRRAEPVSDAPGVYRLPVRWTGSDAPQMWESDTRARFTLVADLAAVKRYPASFTVAEGAFWFHTSDGRSPERHELGHSWGRSGVVVWRSDVTLQGLQVRDAAGPGIAVRGQRAIVEDCAVRNSWRGVSIGGDGSVVRRLRVEDSGGGVYVSAADVAIEDSRLLKRRDAFLFPTNDQDDTGIQFYYPSLRGVASGNLSVGFASCIFVKSRGGARIERNTCVHPGIGSFGVGGGWEYPETAVRGNVVVGFTWPVRGYEAVRPGTVVDGNCLWQSQDERTLEATLAHLAKVDPTRSNRVADPRFAAPDQGDYRLLGGPCAEALAGGPAGAFAAMRPGETPARPRVFVVTLAAPARRIASGLEVYTEHDGRLGGAPARIEEERLPSYFEWQSPVPEVTLEIGGEGARPGPTRIRVSACGAPDWEGPAREPRTVRLPPERPHCVVRVRGAGEDGTWSEPAVLLVRHIGSGPRIRSGPHIRANRHGAVLVFESDLPAALRVETDAAVAVIRRRAWIAGPGAPGAEEVAAARIVHEVVLSARGGAGRHRYRLVLADALGRETSTEWAQIEMDGPARSYFVDPAGRDAEERGSKEAPWQTLQFALDRALPGDRIVLAPGLYPGETVVTQGGRGDAPITVESSVPGGAVLDGAMRVATCLELRNAPFLSFDGLELRWATESMIRATRSPGLTVRNARIWGGLWFGLGTVSSAELRESPGARFERNVIFQCRGPFLRESPRATLVHNTLFSTSFSAVTFLRSARGSVCRNNSLAFNGNEVFSFGVESRDEFTEFDSDYNNLGSHLQPPKETWVAKDPGLPARVQGRRNLPAAYGRFGGVAAKRLVYVNGGQTILFSLEEWQAFSGKDTHSIFADPLYVDVERRDFRLKPGSPNLRAGEGGSTIGALGTGGRP